MIPVPAPGDAALNHYRTDDLLWLATQLWSIAIPAMLLWTGLSARIRTWASPAGRKWPVVAAVYLLVFLALILALRLPLSFYAGYVFPHAYGLSNQTLSGWFTSYLMTFAVPPANMQILPAEIPGFLLGYPFVLLLYWLYKRSPKRWWLYLGAGLIPIISMGALIKPLLLDPLYHKNGAMQDKALEAEILQLARRAGMQNPAIEVVPMSGVTKSMNASVTGFLGTERIEIWDTTIAGLDRRELLTIVGHEIGHYVEGHVWHTVLLDSAFLLAAFALVGVCQRVFKFGRLDDLASLPGFLVALNLSLFLLLPLDRAFLRAQEHEADRFALELTHDNRAAATAFLKLYASSMGVPWHGWFHTTWRDAHPSLGQRVEFANHYGDTDDKN